MSSSTYEIICQQQRKWADKKGKQYESKDHMQKLKDNLFICLSDSSFDEFQSGRGNELGTAKSPGHMYSLHSSSALVVNVFEYWRQSGNIQSIAKACGAMHKMNHLRFEMTYPTPLKGTAPHLDIELSNERGEILVVESKFTEIYRITQPNPRISPRYLTKEGLWLKIPKCGALFTDIYKRGSIGTDFLYMDVIQLLKHILGLSNSKKEFELLYLWYEVTDSPEATKHRQEIKEFNACVGDEIHFRAMTYQELFDNIKKLPEPIPEPEDDYINYMLYLYGRYFPDDDTTSKSKRLNLSELADLEPGGVMTYTPIMRKLKGVKDAEERKRIVIWRLPTALLCALQNEECLKDIKDVIATYPDLISIVIKSDHDLRQDKHYSDWMESESDGYKRMINELENHVEKKEARN
jgi:hypothetical protein